MNRDKKIQEEVQKTMNSLNKLERLEANPYLFTRIEERLKAGVVTPAERPRSFLQLLQPALVACLLLFNVWVAYNIFDSGPTDITYVENSAYDFSYLTVEGQTIENYIPE